MAFCSLRNVFAKHVSSLPIHPPSRKGGRLGNRHGRAGSPRMSMGCGKHVIQKLYSAPSSGMQCCVHAPMHSCNVVSSCSQGANHAVTYHWWLKRLSKKSSHFHFRFFSTGGVLLPLMLNIEEVLKFPLSLLFQWWRPRNCVMPQWRPRNSYPTSCFKSLGLTDLIGWWR